MSIPKNGHGNNNKIHGKVSLWPGSNRRPTEYKSVALSTELQRQKTPQTLTSFYGEKNNQKHDNNLEQERESNPLCNHSALLQDSFDCKDLGSSSIKLLLPIFDCKVSSI